MTKKDAPLGEDITRLEEKDGQSPTNNNKENDGGEDQTGFTEVKNASASGAGSLGKSDDDPR